MKRINNCSVKDDTFVKLIMKVGREFEDRELEPYKIYQSLKSLKVSNTTIARVLNYLMPDKNYNANSINQMVYRNRQKEATEKAFNQMLDKILEDI